MAKKALKKPARKPVPVRSRLPQTWEKITKLPLPYEEVKVPELEVNQAPVRAVLVEPDPLHPRLADAFLIAARRLIDFARRYPQEVQAEPFVRLALARVCTNDPRVKIILALDEETGAVLGHALVTIENDGANTWAFCWQAEIEQRGTGVLQQMINYVTPWIKQHNGTSIVMATVLDPAFWQRAYNFETVRHVMRKAI